MPRSILGGPVTREAALSVGPRAEAQPVSRLSAAQLDSRLRKKRSARYVEQMKRLDAGTHHQNAAALQDLLDAIAAEFPDLTIDQRPLGLVSKCYLGEPYEVHRCDLAGNIVEHFERSRAMPLLFERARSLAAHGAYEFIEIYAGSVRAIGHDGTVAVL